MICDNCTRKCVCKYTIQMNKTIKDITKKMKGTELQDVIDFCCRHFDRKQTWRLAADEKGEDCYKYE